MAMDSLASAAHAAGFAMALVEDGAVNAAGPATEHKAVASAPVVLMEATARWQGTSQPVPQSDGQAASSGSIFGWMPSFSWRADGR
jgi:hypothetical protein